MMNGRTLKAATISLSLTVPFNCMASAQERPIVPGTTTQTDIRVPSGRFLKAAGQAADTAIEGGQMLLNGQHEKATGKIAEAMFGFAADVTRHGYATPLLKGWFEMQSAHQLIQSNNLAGLSEQQRLNLAGIDRNRYFSDLPPDATETQRLQARSQMLDDLLKGEARMRLQNERVKSSRAFFSSRPDERPWHYPDALVAERYEIANRLSATNFQGNGSINPECVQKMKDWGATDPNTGRAYSEEEIDELCKRPDCEILGNADPSQWPWETYGWHMNETEAERDMEFNSTGPAHYDHYAEETRKAMNDCLAHSTRAQCRAEKSERFIADYVAKANAVRGEVNQFRREVVNRVCVAN